MREYPVVTLSNGLRVANFSSPHQFLFEDGTVLEACSPERAKRLMLVQHETEVPTGKQWTDIELRFDMSEVVVSALKEPHADEEVDIVLVPFPVLQVLQHTELLGLFYKCRVIRVADRVTKAIHIDKFCV
jgi:hypothetical protein